MNVSFARPACIGLILSTVFAGAAHAGAFRCNFPDQPPMVIELAYPNPPTVTVDGQAYELRNTALPVMIATIGGASYEFGIKNYGATNKTLPAKLEIRSGGWGGAGQVSYSQKTVCTRLN